MVQAVGMNKLPLQTRVQIIYMFAKDRPCGRFHGWPTSRQYERVFRDRVEPAVGPLFLKLPQMPPQRMHGIDRGALLSRELKAYPNAADKLRDNRKNITAFENSGERIAQTVSDNGRTGIGRRSGEEGLRCMTTSVVGRLMQSVECPLRRRLRRNVGFYGRKVRPRFGHLKQQPALLLVRSLGGSSGTIERLSPITHNVCHWSDPWLSNRTKLPRNQCPHGVAVPLGSNR